MDLSPISLKPYLVDVWCLLNPEFGRLILGVLGLAGLISTIVGIRKLPVSTDTIVTKRNAINRHRFLTIAIGVVAIISIPAFLSIYLLCKKALIDLEAVCDVTKAPDTIVPWLLSLYGVGLVGFTCMAVFQFRAAKPSA